MGSPNTEYTPTIEDLRSAYLATVTILPDYKELNAEFNRFLAEFERQIRAEERAEIVESIQADLDTTDQSEIAVDSWRYGMADAARIAEVGDL